MFICDQDCAFFCDESGISTERHLVVGGLAMRREVIPALQAQIEAFRQQHNMSKELKWTRISNQKLDAYLRFAAIFEEFFDSGLCHFHCLIFDSHQRRRQSRLHDNRDLNLSKLYFDLLLHRFGKIYGGDATLFVRMDHRNSSTSLEELRRNLNSALAREHQISSEPFKHIQSEDSKLCDILQLNDVVLGAVCAARNGRHLEEEGRESKKILARVILAKSGLVSFEHDTEDSARHFTVWNMVESGPHASTP